ncbi:hypothetical protein D3C72_1351020 [compost metagenome]
MDARDEALLKRRRYVEFRLFQRHKESFLGLRSITTELKQKQQVLKGDQPTTVAPSRQAGFACFAVVRNDSVQKAEAVGRGHSQAQEGRPVKESSQFCVERVDDGPQMFVRFERICWDPQSVALGKDRRCGLRTLCGDYATKQLGPK